MNGIGGEVKSQQMGKVPPFPQIYADLVEVFSEECDMLPLHHPTDCTIKIIPGAKLLKPKLYSMMLKEMEKLWWYIDKLARGFIQLACSWIAAPLLFKEKDGHYVYVLILGRSRESV